ncbi:MAG: metal-dependent transcriptional regulator [Propionibacteriaceae bacterium]
MSGDLIDTTEMYLRTIVELSEEGIAPLRARIAERLEQSSPTVSQTVGRMERDGLLRVGEDRAIELSAEGEAQALRVMRRHRLAECTLASIIGIPLELVHDEACRWEHVMTEVVERRLVDLLDHPTHTPYGTPIPALTELGESAKVPAFLDGVQRLTAAIAAGKKELSVVRIGERVQTDVELLTLFVESGILDGRTVTATEVPGGIVLVSDGYRVAIPDGAVESVFVKA